MNLMGIDVGTSSIKTAIFNEKLEMLKSNNIDYSIESHDNIVEFEAEKQEDIEKLCKKLDIDFNSLVTLDVHSIYSHYGIDINNFDKLILEENRK